MTFLTAAAIRVVASRTLGNVVREAAKLMVSVDEHEVEIASGDKPVHLGCFPAFLLIWQLLRPYGPAHLLKEVQGKEGGQEITSCVYHDEGEEV